jgi:hypothetical protein
MQSGNSVSEMSMTGSKFGWEIYMSLLVLRRKVWMERAEYTSAKERRVAYTPGFHQIGRILCTNCLYAYQLPMIASLPNIRESSGHVVRGFIAKFYTREDSRFAEEGMGVKSEPQAKRGTVLLEGRGN